MQYKILRRGKAARSLTRGAVLIETAISLTVLLVLLCSIIQYTVTIQSLNTLQQVTAEGANFYSKHSTDVNASAETTSYMEVVAKGTYLTNSDITNDVKITPVGSNTITPDSIAQVTFSYDMSKRTFFSGIVPGVPTGSNVIKQTVTFFVP